MPAQKPDKSQKIGFNSGPNNEHILMFYSSSSDNLSIFWDILKLILLLTNNDFQVLRLRFRLPNYPFVAKFFQWLCPLTPNRGSAPGPGWGLHPRLLLQLARWRKASCGRGLYRGGGTDPRAKLCHLVYKHIIRDRSYIIRGGEFFNAMLHIF